MQGGLTDAVAASLIPRPDGFISHLPFRKTTPKHFLLESAGSLRSMLLIESFCLLLDHRLTHILKLFELVQDFPGPMNLIPTGYFWSCVSLGQSYFCGSLSDKK